ncbi:MAG: putative xanthine dehydrogenase subunit [Planctomycetota bacterium]
MRDLVPQLESALAAAQPFAYCRLVETRGSTPQKAGATMLVFPDGSQAGTLGGGCVEAEVKRRAIGALDAARPLIAAFQLDSDYGWDDGLICGGRMLVVIWPVVDEASRGYFARLARQVDGGDGVTEAAVFDSEASGLAAPALFLFDSRDRAVAALNGPTGSAIAAGESDLTGANAGGAPSADRDDNAVLGGPESFPARVCETLRPIAGRPRPYATRGVAYLPILPRCRLVIVGGGHVGKAVAEMAADLDFAVWIVDDRADYTDATRFPRVERRIHGPIEQVLPALDVTPDTYCLIVTRGHGHDERALYYLANRGARYVGLIGSRRKIKLIFDDLRQEGVPVESLRQVYAPVGLDIGSQTVPEIAVSICAELVAHRNLGEVPARPKPVPVE